METKPLKPASFWWLVVVNYLSSFFVAGLLGTAALFGVAALSGNDLLTGWQPGLFLIQGIYLAALCITTWNSARYLRTHYVIPHPKKVVTWTAGVFIALTLAGYLMDYLGTGLMPDAFSILFPVINLAVFYILSEKFLRNSSAI